MTAAQETALRELLDDVCTSESSAAFCDRWGASSPSEHRPGGIHVNCPPTVPFVGLELRPWGGAVTGVVDVELRAGDALDWAVVGEQFGPFQEISRLGTFEHWYQALWDPPGTPASVALLVRVMGHAVDAITLRRDAH
jgi:hypothetical protein